MKKNTRGKLTPEQRRIQDALRIIVDWEKDVFRAAGREWTARRDEIFWGLLSYAEEGDLTPRWFELAEESLLKALPRDVRERVDKKTRKATLLGFSTEKKQRRAGRRRGKQETAAKDDEWSNYQEAANVIWERNPALSKLEVARRVHNRRFPGVSAETIRKRIQNPFRRLARSRAACLNY